MEPPVLPDVEPVVELPLMPPVADESVPMLVSAPLPVPVPLLLEVPEPDSLPWLLLQLPSRAALSASAANANGGFKLNMVC